VEIAALAAQTVVALVLLAAGLAKFAAPRGQVATTVRQYGIDSPRTARIVAIGLPIVECGLGATLFLGAWPVIISLASLALLVTFTAFSVRALRQGRRFQCNCFGSFRATPIGYGLVLRNVGLMGLLGIVLAEAASSGDIGNIGLAHDLQALGPATHLIPYLGLLLLFSAGLLLIDHVSIVVDPTNH
jgi:Methylamine utilisation protein MauE